MTSQQTVNDLIMKSRYNEAIALAKKELKQLVRLPSEPDIDWWVRKYSRHWYLTHISTAYYEKRKYKIALEWDKKAIEANNNCPLVLWNYAGTLFQLGHVEEAIKQYKAIYSRGRNGLAYGICTEGMEHGLEMRSDCRIRLAICYYSIDDLANALKWCKLFLRYFRNGGIEKRKFGETLLKRYKKEIEDERRQTR
jgi:tetratricopeptide (TPR) repeat protein